MHAVRIDRHGGPEVLTVQTIPDPQPGPGEVLVRTAASSLNPVDWKTRAQDAGTLPATLGWDLAGIVVTSNDPRWRRGDRVIAMSAQIATGRGTWAELVALPARLLAPAPTTVSLIEAATLPLAGLTARQGLDALDLRHGQRLLITGAAGAVGGLAVQLARAAGIAVDALVSRDEHLNAARDLGADQATSDPTDLNPAAYAAVFDTAGVDVSRALATGGRYLSISDDPLPDIAGAARNYVQEDGRQLAQLTRFVDTGRLRLRVAATYPLGQVRAAHSEFEAGGLLGKIVLTFEGIPA
ncbi:NADP-dependent oxidoreductase [Nocardia sp. NPDC001965]